MRLPLLPKGDPTQIDEKAATQLIRFAIDEGVNYIDTAYPYHGRGTGSGGHSEPFVGKVLQDGYRDGVFPESPSDMAAWVPRLIQAGANVIGGCCGTTPDHIKAIRKAVESYQRE